MVNLKGLFDTLKNSFSIQKEIKIDGIDLTILLEPLTTAEEIKAMEAIKDLDGNAFIDGLKKNTLAYAIKKINELEFKDSIIEFEDESGQPLSKSKYLFIHEQIELWPSILRDRLFEAYNDMQLELEARVTKGIKFNKFTPEPKEDIKPETKENIPEGFRKIDDKDTEESTDEMK